MTPVTLDEFDAYIDQSPDLDMPLAVDLRAVLGLLRVYASSLEYRCIGDTTEIRYRGQLLVDGVSEKRW